jgi:Carboxypeptidase regulatory-like domain
MNTKLLVGFTILYSLLLPWLVAQEFRATVKGLVTDTSGAGIPSAKVAARNTATNEDMATVANGQGQYTLPLLRPGMYELSAEVPGFKKFVRENITLDVGQTATIDIELEVGNLNEQVTVTTEAPLLDTAKSDRGAVIDHQRVTEFALNGRNAILLSRLVPGVAFTGVIYAQGTTSQGSIENWAINGSQQRMNAWLLDGAPNDEKAYQNGVAYVPPADSVQEFKVQTNSYDAQYGRTGGGIINLSVKSGTNSFHGTAYEFAQRTGWTANLFQNNAIGAPRDNTLFDQYGFEVEGPVILPKVYNGRNKMFFMVASEFQRKATPHAVLDSVPTPEMLNGDFSKLVDSQGRLISIYNPFTGRNVNGVWTRDPFPGNTIPQNMINPIARNILGYMPKPNIVTPGQAYAQLDYAVPGGQNPGLTPTQSVVGKLDQNFGDKHRVFFRRGWNNFFYRDSDNGIRTTPGVKGDFGERKINDAYALDWVYLPSASMVFNVRLSFNFFNDDVYVQENANFDLTKLGFPASLNNQLALTNWFPSLTFSGYLSLGRDPLLDHTNNFSVQPNWSYFHGSHSLKAGMDLRRIQHAFGDYYDMPHFTLAADPGFTQRDYTRPDALSGDSISSFLLGTPSSGSGVSLATPFYTNPYYAPWIQDDWKVNRRLT